MSIASEITRLSGVRSDIFTSITNKGVSVPVGSTFSSCPSLIDSIVTGGGGGDPTSLINPTFTASGLWSAYRPFTATQNQIPVYDYITYTGDIPSFSNATFTLANYKTTADSPQTATFTGTIQQWASIGSTTGTITRQGSPTVYGTWSVQQQSQTDIYLEFYITAYPVDTNQFFCNDMNWAWGIASVSPYTASYREQTGTDVPYPNYDITTTGYIENLVSGIEKWNNGKAILSSDAFKHVEYYSSPSITSIYSQTSSYVDTFSSNMLKNYTQSKINNDGNDSNYTYTYGTVETAYSGFTGV